MLYQDKLPQANYTTNSNIDCKVDYSPENVASCYSLDNLISFETSEDDLCLCEEYININALLREYFK